MKQLYTLVAALALSLGLVSQTTQTFNYTGAVQTFTVPTCVTSITVDCKGAQGGATGGNGGRVTCVLPVTPGDILYIYVGGQGGGYISQSPGGFNGGGNAGICNVQYFGAGGGGASDIRLNSTSLNSRVVVAGGGGGSHQINSTNNAGAGGGLVGGNVTSTGNGCIATYATGGTQSAGGNPATATMSCCFFTPVPGGSFGVGGNGAGPSNNCNNGDGGAGGGGGWYGGGGGGTYSSGGGGSSYTAVNVTSVVHTQGFQAGNGQVIITYTAGTPPAQPGAITGSTSVCAGTTGNYSISAVPLATSYTWTVPPGAIINSGQGTTSINVTFGTTPGNISVTAYSNPSCGSPVRTQAITVNANPVVALGSDVTQCGGTVLLDAGNPGSTFLWSNSSTTQTITASTSGTYSVTVTNVNGCTGTDAINVTINTPPTVALGNDITQCGGTAVLNAGNPGASYLWSNSATTQTITVGTSGMYSVVVTDANGCTGTDVISVTFNTPPVVALGSDITQCGGTALLDAGNPGASYLWSNSSTTQTITVSNTGTYAVTVTDANGCTGTDVINVTINSLPTVALGPDTATCSTFMLDAGNPGASYLWSNASTTQTVNVGPGTYSVVVTDANGCTGTDVVVIAQGTAPTVDLGPDIVQCGGTVLLDANNPGAGYLWSTGATTQTITVSTTSSYTVTVTDPSGCTGTDVIAVTINQLPTVTLNIPVTTVCVNWPAFALTGGSPSSGTYSGPGVSSGNFNPAVAGVGNQTITYTYTDGNNCTDTAQQVIVVSACTGIDENILSSLVNVYPNPSRSSLTIECEVMIESVSIFNALGEKVTEWKINDKTFNGNVTSLTSGVYLIKILTEKGTILKKIVKE